MQAQGLQLQDELNARKLAPQFVQKDANGKPIGFDNQGYFAALLGSGMNPQSVTALQMKNIELQKGMIGLSEAQQDQHKKVSAELYGLANSVLKANQDAAAASAPGNGPSPAAGIGQSAAPANSAAQGQAAPMSEVIPGIGGTPALLPNSAPGSAAAPTASIAGEQPPAGSKPINVHGQMAYQAALPRLMALTGPDAENFPHSFTMSRKCTISLLDLGSTKQQLKDAKTVAETQQSAGKGALDTAEAGLKAGGIEPRQRC